jgi:hypothetical protein
MEKVYFRLNKIFMDFTDIQISITTNENFYELLKMLSPNNLMENRFHSVNWLNQAVNLSSVYGPCLISIYNEYYEDRDGHFHYPVQIIIH